MRYEEIIKNKKLTDFEETKKLVINYFLKDVPKIQKDNSGYQTFL